MKENDRGYIIECQLYTTKECKDCGRCKGTGRWIEPDIEYNEDDIDVQVSYDD